MRRLNTGIYNSDIDFAYQPIAKRIALGFKNKMKGDSLRNDKKPGIKNLNVLNRKLIISK